jgi:hypothetical protein
MKKGSYMHHSMTKEKTTYAEYTLKDISFAISWHDITDLGQLLSCTPRIND